MKKPEPPPNLWDLLDAEFQRELPPADGVSIAEFAKKYGMTHAKAEAMLDRLVRSGKVKFLGHFGPRQSKYYGIAS